MCHGRLTHGPEFVPADACGDGALERLAHDRVSRAQRARSDSSRRSLRLGQPRVLARFPSLQGLERVSDILSCRRPWIPKSVPVGMAIEIRRQVGVGQIDRWSGGIPGA